MDGVSSSRHGFFKYLYDGKTHYILVEPTFFNHCNLIQALNLFSMLSLFPITILMNNNPNQASSSLQAPQSLHPHPNLPLRS